jgi:capsular exopolysaccharide synthesis family protein
MEATRYLAIVRRWWWLLIIGTLMSLAAYGIASRVRDRVPPTPRFSAATTIFVSDEQAGQGAAAPATASLQAAASDRLMRTYVEVIKGPDVALRMIERLGLQTSVAELQRHIDVVTPPGTQLIQVTTTAENPADAQRLADGVVQSFIALHDEGRMPGTMYVSSVAPAEQTIVQSRSDWRVVLVVAVFGLLSAASIVVIFEFLTDTVRDVADAEFVTGVPVLANIPLWSGGRGGRFATAIAGRRAADAAERFRMLRTAIRLKTKDRPAQVLLFSGANQSAGTTTTAANYAFALAQSGRRVAIVDANLREPAQHRMFGIDSTPGLAEALASSETGLDAILHATSIDGISVVPAGLCPANPSELLDSLRLDEMLAQMRERFDAIIIDSPPALASTDATLLAARADAAIIVVRSDQTARSKAAAAVNMLDKAAPRIMGVVLNGDPSTPGLRAFGAGRSTAQSSEVRA